MNTLHFWKCSPVQQKGSSQTNSPASPEAKLRFRDHLGRGASVPDSDVQAKAARETTRSEKYTQ
jgi:hypothetical protein